MGLAGAACLCAQGLDTSVLGQPPTSAWPIYNGDYSGRRYSPLSVINKHNVASLQMAWAFQTEGATLKCTPLEVNGVVYFTVPDQVWAVDARTGRQIWHFRRPSEGDHIGQRGVALYKDRVYFGTPDAHLICLDARNGEQIWDVQIADVKFWLLPERGAAGGEGSFDHRHLGRPGGYSTFSGIDRSGIRQGRVALEQFAAAWRTRSGDVAGQKCHEPGRWRHVDDGHL